jgi:pyruvate/2-oxoglutarate dehydrogenase complex dihydrolipoamide dehydrogenase (E3) component
MAVEDAGVTTRLDAVIIGTGQAGKPLAGALAEAGWRVAIIERDRVGGTCLIRGCTPTKTMVASARVAHIARRSGDYGVQAGPVSVNMAQVRARKRDVVDSFSESAEKGMTRHATLELVFGEAAFVDTHTIDVHVADGGSRRFEAPRIFVNTGTRPQVPALDGLDTVRFLDSTSIMELSEVPDHLLILGGGFIGLEFAQMFRRFGARVTVVEQHARIAGMEDDDVADALMELLQEDGIAFHAGTTARSVAATAGAVSLEVEGDGQTTRLHGSHLLVAVGRVPNTEALHLERAGIDTDERGYISVNDRLETNVEGVYALGEVSGGPPFTHAAYDDFRIIEAQLLNGTAGRSRQDRLVPYVVFTDPELGRVGITEREARDRGLNVKVARLPMKRVARAVEMDETRGFIKAVVDAESNRIVGAAVLGTQGGEIMSLIQTAMLGDLPCSVLRDAIYAHPTLAESMNNLFAHLE